VSFPGFVVVVFGAAGAWLSRRSDSRANGVLYGGLVVLALWASFGPAAGLYAVLYKSVPLFAWLRAPARFGLIVLFGLTVLTGIGISAFLRLQRHAAMAAGILLVAAVGEHVAPSNLRDVPPVEPVYRTLASLPRGPVIEMPFFYLPYMFPRHTQYMLNSTTHWMPLVNGYSDYTPPDFLANVMMLAPFPSRDAFKLLEPNKVRYAVFHMYGYNEENRHDVLGRLKEFQTYLRPIFDDQATRLYEIVNFPP
jgi:hypothetical protein